VDVDLWHEYVTRRCIALGLHWDCIGIALGLHSDCIGIALGLITLRYGAIGCIALIVALFLASSTVLIIPAVAGVIVDRVVNDRPVVCYHRLAVPARHQSSWALPLFDCRTEQNPFHHLRLPIRASILANCLTT
jgi:hypothetical protein